MTQTLTPLSSPGWPLVGLLRLLGVVFPPFLTYSYLLPAFWCRYPHHGGRTERRTAAGTFGGGLSGFSIFRNGLVVLVWWCCLVRVAIACDAHSLFYFRKRKN